MNKRKKLFLSTGPAGGTSTEVIDGDLSFALKCWKKKVKASGKLQTFFEKRYFEKRSTKRKKILDNARYLNSVRVKGENTK